MKRLIFAAVLTLMTLTMIQAQPTIPSVSVRRTLDVDGVERVYSLYVPESLDTSTPAPLVIALHGRFSSGKALEAISRLDREADSNGWIVAYPQAYQYSWEDGGRESGLPRIGDPSDDVGFLDALAESLQQEFEVSEVVLAGFDTGGSMIQRQLCEGQTPVSAALLVSSVGWSQFADLCDGKHISTRMLFLFGLSDTTYTSNGDNLTDYPRPDGTPNRRFGFYETMAFWAEAAACGETPTLDGLVNSFEDCAEGAAVSGALIQTGGHEWFRSGEFGALTGFPEAVDGATALAAWIEGEAPVVAPLPADSRPPSRTLIAYVPTTYTGEEPLPLVMALHGRPDSGAGIAWISDFSVVAEDEGFIMVFPDGLNKEWNYLGGIVSDPTGRPNDIEFLNTLIDDLAIDLNIDQSRMYLTGFSNGGFMTYRMACHPAPNRFAAYGVAGALLYPEMEIGCMNAPIRPIVIEHGTHDISIAWDGITHMPSPGMLAVTRTALQSASFFAARNGCPTGSAIRTDVPSSDEVTQVVQFDFEGCQQDATVRFYAIMNGGHAWPGVNRLRGEIAGNTNMDIHLSREMWEFFEAHPMAGSEEREEE